MYHYPTPPPSGRTAAQELLLLAEVGLPVDPDTLRRAGYVEVEIAEPSRRRRRKSPKPVSIRRLGLVLLSGEIAPFPPAEGLISDAIASETAAPAQARKRNGAHRTAALLTVATAMVGSAPRIHRIRPRKVR